MTVYVDTSAVLRVVLGEAGALTELRRAKRLISSELLEVESRRTIDASRARARYLRTKRPIAWLR